MKDKLSTTGAVNVLIAFLILLARLMPSPAEAAEAKPREMLKLRLGLGSAPAPPLPNSVLWLAKDLGFYATRRTRRRADRVSRHAAGDRGDGFRRCRCRRMYRLRKSSG